MEPPSSRVRTPPSSLLGFGLDPRTIDRLARDLGVEDAFDLAHACRTNRVRDGLSGGAALQDRLRSALETTPWHGPRPLAAARARAQRLLARLEADPAAIRLAIAGATRRMCATVEALDLVATAHDVEALTAAFVGLPFVGRVLEQAAGRAAVELEDGLVATLRVVPEDDHAFFPLVLFRTGPAAHVEALVERAASRGLRLDETGLYDDGAPLPLWTEAELYERLGRAFVPPELRDAEGIEAPEPTLVRMHDVQGLMHVHTTYAAGSLPVADMATHAATQGYAWMVVADRAPTARPKGLPPGALAGQALEIASVNDDPDAALRVFHGAEARILSDGRLDVPAEEAERVDLLVAVVEDTPEDRAEASPATLTARLVAAAVHPRVRVLGHLRTERLRGPPVAPDWDAVFAACAAHGTALEVSGESHHVEPSPAWHRGARTAGVWLAPAADAHDAAGIDNAIVAVGTARRGGWPREQVLATLDASALAAWLGGTP